MARLDVLIVPSTWYENTPTVIYEALASGTPVVATDHGGMRELVDAYRGGWLFPRGDVGARASLMKRLVENRDLVRRAAAGIRRVPGFAAHFEEVALVYEQALSRESTP
jgi:glycosyltransferase involved in cell wall biosynthesis